MVVLLSLPSFTVDHLTKTVKAHSLPVLALSGTPTTATVSFDSSFIEGFFLLDFFLCLFVCQRELITSHFD